MDSRDREALERMLLYCRRAQSARARHFPTRKVFDEDRFYGDGIAMYVQQIGECVNDLSESFIDSHPEVPWRQIRGMRNIIAHAYEGVDPEVVWDVLVGNLPELERTCASMIGEDE